MNLASQQRQLLGLLRCTYRPSDGDDVYIRTVAQSRALIEGRRNIFLWRTWVLERTCPLTVRLLRQYQVFDPILAIFIERNNISPFRETQAPAFLEWLSNHSDRLIRSVAQFELALLKVRDGDIATYKISWSVDPYVILCSLANDMPLNNEAVEGAFNTVVSHDIPHHFQICEVKPLPEVD